MYWYSGKTSSLKKPKTMREAEQHISLVARIDIMWQRIRVFHIIDSIAQSGDAMICAFQLFRTFEKRLPL